MKIVATLLFFVVLVKVAHSSVEFATVDQNELFEVDDEINPKSKAVCAVHKTIGPWQCIMNCVVVVPDEEDVQMRQHRFRSCIVARAMIRHMEKNPFMAKHISLRFNKNKMSDKN